MLSIFRPYKFTAPASAIEDGAPLARVAFLGVDLPGVRPKLDCLQGDRVSCGQPLFHDRAHPDIVFASPVDGMVETITLGPRRNLSALVIRLAPDKNLAETDRIAAASEQDVRSRLLANGLWSCFLTRPYGRIPAPDAEPEAIFVTATAGHPHAPDPRLVINGRGEHFRSGLEALTQLTAGMVHVCQNPGPDLTKGMDGRIRGAFFPGGPSSGLAGAHIHRLHPVGGGGMVWSVNYQDVLDIGTLVDTGKRDFSRIVCISGARARRPRLIRTVLGANLHDLIVEESQAGQGDKPLSVISGSPAAGRPASWLGRYHQQIVLMDGSAADRIVKEHWFWPRRTRPGPLIPTAAIENALGFDIPAIPFLRALSVGDAETAKRLGCLEMVEEDLAAASLACTSGADYGRMLRHVLDELAEEA